jgi:hypothetical protein
MQVELLAQAESRREIRSGRSAGHDDEAVWIRKGKRPEQHSIHDAEHPDHGPDGKGEGDNRSEEKSRRADEGAPRVTEVRQQRHDQIGSLTVLEDSTEMGTWKFAPAVSSDADSGVQ